MGIGPGSYARIHKPHRADCGSEVSTHGQADSTRPASLRTWRSISICTWCSPQWLASRCGTSAKTTSGLACVRSLEPPPTTRSLETVQHELGELVLHELNALEADGERERVSSAGTASKSWRCQPTFSAGFADPDAPGFTDADRSAREADLAPGRRRINLAPALAPARTCNPALADVPAAARQAFSVRAGASGPLPTEPSSRQAAAHLPESHGSAQT